MNYWIQLRRQWEWEGGEKSAGAHEHERNEWRKSKHTLPKRLFHSKPQNQFGMDEMMWSELHGGVIHSMFECVCV